MPSPRPFFIGGIHGSGKSTLCRELAPRIGALHITAGALIRETGLVVPQKQVASVDGNQLRLLAALDAMRRTTAVPLLLDGHFCLLDAQDAVVPIPVATFRAIDPCRLLLLETDEAEVANRLQKRNGAAVDVHLLRRFAQQEREHARRVSTELAIPLRILTSTSALGEAAEFLALSQAP